MTRIIHCVLLVASLCLAASAGVNPGSISGYVRNTGGTPQMGATVQLVSAAGQFMVVHTDGRGYFAASGLTPGNYDVHVSAPSFLPTLREDVVLAAGASKVLNITLNTLFEAVGMLPRSRRAMTKMTAGNGRCGIPPTVLSCASITILPDCRDPAGRPAAEGTLALMAGATSEGYGSSSDLGTAFSIEQSLFHTGLLDFPATWVTATARRTGSCALPTFVKEATDGTSRWR